MKLRSVAAKLLSLVVGSSGCAAEPTEVIRLWPDAAPGSEQRRHEPEVAKDWWVANVHDPSLTVVRPKRGTATGAAVIVIPGGGHRQLVFEPEGMAPARYLARQGVTAFALKYRLAKEKGSSYSVEEHALADVRRAVRWVRSAADRYGIDPARVGVMGWSAGGELAALVSYGPSDADSGAKDAVDRLSARPNFQIVIYPGPLGVPASLPAAAPPAFFLAASDDAPAARTIERLLSLYQNAGIPVEVHLYETGGHAFNMGSRSRSQAIRRWPARLSEWLEVRGLARSPD